MRGMASSERYSFRLERNFQIMDRASSEKIGSTKGRKLQARGKA